MTLDELQRVCPSLEDTLRKESSLRTVVESLLRAGLGGVFGKYLRDASPGTLRTFLHDAGRVDLGRVVRHRELLRRKPDETLRPQDVEPVPLVTLEEQHGRSAEDRAAGRRSLEQGAWASVAFAGGAGTRFFSSLDELGRALEHPNEVLLKRTFDPSEPKGVFPVSPVGGLSFYEIIIAEALHCGLTTCRLPRVLLLTSSVTHERTVRYLSGRNLWGFPDRAWIGFEQAREPRLDPDQDLIVEDDRGHLNWTGDGHGGVYRALLSPDNARGGDPSLLAFLEARGVRHLVMHNVDNPAARPFEPSRLGFHLREGALFTLSAVRKIDPNEKVGLVMRILSGGRVEVVEYNVLSTDIAHARHPDSGRLLHEAGNTNTNLVATEAIQSDIEPTIYTDKTVASRTGPVAASSMEMLNQHITRLLDPERVRAFEVDRREFFMPTKNVAGVDSVESTSRMLSDLAARRLRDAGAEVDSGALCDLHPCCRETGVLGLGPGWRIEAGARLYLNARYGDPSGGPVGRGKLRLEPGSSLVVDAALPLGPPRIGPALEFEARPAGASCIRIGNGVVVERGVRVVVRAGAGARVTVADGRIFSRNLEAEVPAGQDCSL